MRGHRVQAASALSVAVLLATRTVRDARNELRGDVVSQPTEGLEPTSPARQPGSPPRVLQPAPAARTRPFWFDARPSPIEPVPASDSDPPARLAAGPVGAPPPRSAPAPPNPSVTAPPPPPSRATATAEVTAEPPWAWTEPWRFDLGDHSPTDHRRGRARARPSRRAQVLAIGAAVTCLFGALIVASRFTSDTARAASRHEKVDQIGISAYAARTIPAHYLRVYLTVAREYGLDWETLAAVGEVESEQGRSQEPGVSAGTNDAGAAGPAQFEAATWARYGVDADGGGGINPYDPVDAITAMAAYLKASGAPQDWREALYTYNHSDDYVDEILALSKRLAGSGTARG